MLYNKKNLVHACSSYFFFGGWKNCPLPEMCLSQSASQRLRICIHSGLSSDKRATRWHLSWASLSAYSPLVFCCHCWALCCCRLCLSNNICLTRLQSALISSRSHVQWRTNCCHTTQDKHRSDFQFNLPSLLRQTFFANWVELFTVTLTIKELISLLLLFKIKQCFSCSGVCILRRKGKAEISNPFFGETEGFISLTQNDKPISCSRAIKAAQHVPSRRYTYYIVYIKITECKWGAEIEVKWNNKFCKSSDTANKNNSIKDIQVSYSNLSMSGRMEFRTCVIISSPPAVLSVCWALRILENVPNQEGAYGRGSSSPLHSHTNL